MPRVGYCSRSATSKSSAREAGFMVISTSRSPIARQKGSASLTLIFTLRSHLLFREFAIEFLVGDFLVGAQAAAHHGDDPPDIIIGEQTIGAFGNLQNFCDIRGVFFDLIFAEEEAHVMFAR